MRGKKKPISTMYKKIKTEHKKNDRREEIGAADYNCFAMCS